MKPIETLQKVQKVQFTLEELFNDIKIVNFKTFKGHDLDQFDCDIKYKGKHITNVWDDSWGGGFQYTNEKELQKLFDITQYENDYLDCFVEDLINMHLERKEDKKGIIINPTKKGYEILKYKYPLEKCIKLWGEKMVGHIQKDVDKILNEGSTIRNVSYLKSLGVKFK